MSRPFLGALEHVEGVLLSPSGRERVHAITTFSVIFVFAMTSVDFIVAGGADFGAPRSPELRISVEISQHSAPDRGASEASAVPADQSMPTAVAPELADVTEANVFPVSQSFDATLIGSTNSAQAQQLLTPIAASLIEAGRPSETSLIGDLTEQMTEEAATTELVRPRKAPVDSPELRGKPEGWAASSQ